MSSLLLYGFSAAVKVSANWLNTKRKKSESNYSKALICPNHKVPKYFLFRKVPFNTGFLKYGYSELQIIGTVNLFR
jgi:hypothetical protein